MSLYHDLVRTRRGLTVSVRTWARSVEAQVARHYPEQQCWSWLLHFRLAWNDWQLHYYNLPVMEQRGLRIGPLHFVWQTQKRYTVI